MTHAIDVQGLQKRYRFQAVLSGLDFQVPAHCIFGFVGPKGSGKSTTLKILAGLIKADAGTVTIMGHSAGSVQSRRCFGYVPERALYHEFMTAEELLWTHAGLAGVPRSERAACCDQALELTGLQHHKKSRLRNYSDVMKQRFGFAQALIGEPPVLIIDEPAVGTEIKELMLKLRERGYTIFFATRRMTEVESVCERVAMLQDGVIQCCGAKSEVLHSGQTCRIVFQAPMRIDLPWALESNGAVQIATVPGDEGERALEKIRRDGGLVLEYTRSRAAARC